MPVTRVAHGPASAGFYLVLLALVAAGGLTLRLYGLGVTGVGGNDTILYYTLAEQWLDGNFVFRIGESVQVFRPVLLGFNALALQVFGHVDHAIKLANVALDSANLLLLSLLAWLICRRFTVVLASAASYAVLPIAIWSARQELAHTLSTFFALGSYLLLWLATTRGTDMQRLGCAFLAGLCVGAAALTHEELIFLAVPLALFMLLAGRLRGEPWTPAPDLGRVAAFSVAPIAAAALVLVHESGPVRFALDQSLAAVQPGGRFLPEVFGRFLWDAVVGTMSAPAALAVGFCFFCLAWYWRPGAPRTDLSSRLWLGFCLLAPVTFVGLYAMFFKTLFARGFLPLVPLLIIAIFACVDRVSARAGPLLSDLALAGLVVVLAVSNLAAYSAFNAADRRFSSTWAAPVWPGGEALRRGYREFILAASYIPGYATHWRALFDALDGQVDEERRLLVLPSTVIYSPGRRPLQTAVYFGDNAVYRLDHAHQTLDEIVRDYRVRWVLFTVGQRRRAPTRHGRYLYDGQWAEREPLDLARAYGMQSYSAQAEFSALLRFLERVGATEVLPFPGGSYESRVARLWRLPAPDGPGAGSLGSAAGR